jgi:hypothetical protein
MYIRRLPTAHFSSYSMAGLLARGRNGKQSFLFWCKAISLLFPRISAQQKRTFRTNLQLGCRGTLPNDPVPEGSLEDETFLKQFHHALLEVRVLNGTWMRRGCYKTNTHRLFIRIVLASTTINSLEHNEWVMITGCKSSNSSGRIFCLLASVHPLSPPA